MLVPIFGFVLSCVVFSVTAVVLAVVVTIFIDVIEVSRGNVLLFLLGAFPGQLLGMVAYGLLFRGHTQPATAASFLLSVYVGGVIGGLVSWLLRGLLKRQSASES